MAKKTLTKQERVDAFRDEFAKLLTKYGLLASIQLHFVPQEDFSQPQVAAGAEPKGGFEVKD